MRENPVVPRDKQRQHVATGPRLLLALVTALIGWAILALWLLFDPDPDPVWVAVEDIVGHALLFFVGASIGHAIVMDSRHWPQRYLAFIAGIFVVVVLEIAQEVLPSGRAGEFSDIVAGGAGVAAGVVAVWGLSMIAGLGFTKVAVAASGWLTIVVAVLVAALNPPA